MGSVGSKEDAKGSPPVCVYSTCIVHIIQKMYKMWLRYCQEKLTRTSELYSEFIGGILNCAGSHLTWVWIWLVNFEHSHSYKRVCSLHTYTTMLSQLCMFLSNELYGLCHINSGNCLEMIYLGQIFPSQKPAIWTGGRCRFCYTQCKFPLAPQRSQFTLNEMVNCCCWLRLPSGAFFYACDRWQTQCRASRLVSWQLQQFGRM